MAIVQLVYLNKVSSDVSDFWHFNDVAKTIGFCSPDVATLTKTCNSSSPGSKWEQAIAAQNWMTSNNFPKNSAVPGHQVHVALVVAWNGATVASITQQPEARFWVVQRNPGLVMSVWEKLVDAKNELDQALVGSWQV